MSSNNRSTGLIFATIFAVALLTSSARASVERAIALDEKVDKADSIVLGKVVRTQSAWDSTHQWILTYSTFQVEKTIKGTPVQEVTVAVPGGTVDDVSQDTIGMPGFDRGSEHVIFVKRSSIGPTVAFFDQGAYDVTKNDSGERVVAPMATDAVRMDLQRGVAVAPEEARSLREFETNVRESMRNIEAQRMEMIEQKRLQEASFWSVVKRNRLLVALALLGIGLATWRFVRR